MRWVTVDLISNTKSVNDLGDIIRTKTYSERFAKLLSVRQSEFYQARSIGLRPEHAFEMKSIDYSGEKQLRYDSKEYEIIRTYNKGENIELICQGIVNAVT